MIKIAKRVCLICASLICILWFYLFTQQMNTAGIVNFTEKYEKGGKYYVVVGFVDRPVHMKVNEKDYPFIVCDEQVAYHIKFIYFNFNPEKGYLKYLNFDDEANLNVNVEVP